MKTNILSDGNILENGTFSSDEDFGLVSKDDQFDSDFDDIDLKIVNLPDNDNLDTVDKNSLSYDENEYNQFTDSPIVENTPFMGTAGLKCTLKGDQPIDYFNFSFADELFDLLVEEINAYAINIFLNSTPKNARIYSCINTNKSEIK